jgi:DNA-binding CsgD family transcriptional regulator
MPPAGALPFAKQLEADDALRAWLKRAGLTAVEEAVTHLQVQGYADQEIAQELGRTLWSVKNAWRRAKGKLAKTVPH